MTVYLSVDQILFIHARAIEKFGGAHGIRDMGLVEAASARPQMTFQGKDLFPDLYGKAAALCHSLCTTHPFLDGNKRTAFASMDLFLQENGLIITADDDSCESIILRLVTRKVDENGLTRWLKKNTSSFPPENRQAP